VFAYGQTGSGKTYTMEGYKYEAADNARGIKPIIGAEMDYGVTIRAIRRVFDQAKAEKSKTI